VTSAARPDLEWTLQKLHLIRSLAKLPEPTGVVWNMGIGAYCGSFMDDGIGEDFVPNEKLSTVVTFGVASTLPPTYVLPTFPLVDPCAVHTSCSECIANQCAYCSFGVYQGVGIGGMCQTGGAACPATTISKAASCPIEPVRCALLTSCDDCTAPTAEGAASGCSWCPSASGLGRFGTGGACGVGTCDNGLAPLSTCPASSGSTSDPTQYCSSCLLAMDACISDNDGPSCKCFTAAAECYASAPAAAGSCDAQARIMTALCSNDFPAVGQCSACAAGDTSVTTTQPIGDSCASCSAALTRCVAGSTASPCSCYQTYAACAQVTTSGCGAEADAASKSCNSAGCASCEPATSSSSTASSSTGAATNTTPQSGASTGCGGQAGCACTRDTDCTGATGLMCAARGACVMARSENQQCNDDPSQCARGTRCMLTKASMATLVCSSLSEGGATCTADATCASARCVQGACAPLSLLVSASTGSGNSGTSKAATAGAIAVAVILAVCVVTLVVFVVYRRRQKSRVVVVKPINDANYELAGAMTPLPQPDVAISVVMDDTSYAEESSSGHPHARADSSQY